MINLAVVTPVKDLAPSQILEMSALLQKHFRGVSKEQFARDLNEKSHVILLRQAGSLTGFSTLRLYRSQGVNVVYSGDTIVTPVARGSTVLARAWINAVLNLRLQFPEGPLHWLLLTSGYRTYRFLPVFWKVFYPRQGIETPPDQLYLLNRLADELFGSQFDPVSGIVRFRQPQPLRDDLADVPQSRLQNTDVVFFLRRNPVHAKGDELVCLTEISDANLTAAGRRMLAPCR